MRSGFDAVKAAIEESASRGQGGGGFLPTIVWKDDRNGEGKLYDRTVRFLTDEVVPCKIYEYIPCKDGKLRDFIIPSSVGEDGPDIVKESGVQVSKFGNKNQMVDPRAKDVTIGLVVLREEKPEMVDGRRVLTVVDKMETVKYEKDGKQVEEERPVYGIVKQSNTNFWGTVAGYWSRYGTITDRDYNITRNGNDVNTNYTIIPLDPIEELRDEDKLKEAYKPPMTLEEYIKNMTSVERAKKLLYGDSSEGEGKATKEKAEESAPEKVESESGTQFDSLRDELLKQD